MARSDIGDYATVAHMGQIRIGDIGDMKPCNLKTQEPAADALDVVDAEQNQGSSTTSRASAAGAAPCFVFKSKKNKGTKEDK